MQRRALVWVVPVRAGGPFGWQAGRRHLDAGDARRAARFRDPADANRLAVSRGVLRALVDDGWPQHAAAVVCHHPGRAPRLAAVPGANPPPLLSLSHSGGLVVAAAADGPVGVDVETLPARPPGAAFLRRVLTAGERREIEDLGDLGTGPPAAATGRFTELWVRKEAALKACGTASLADLPAIDVRRDRITAMGQRLRLQMLDAGGHHSAAVAVEPRLAVEVGYPAGRPL